MRCLLLLVPLALCSAQTPVNIDVANWVSGVVLPNNNSEDPNNRFQSGNDDSDINLTQSEKAKNSCTTPDGKPGKCVKPNFCDKPQTPIDTTVLFDLREGGCPHHLLQCCPLDKVKTEPEPPRQVPDGCGWSNPGGYSLRASADGIADFGEFPWMVALLKKSQFKQWREDDYLGGGSLIHPKVVITVAHKVENRDPAELKCRAGEWDTQTLKEILPHQERNVAKIIVHEEFLQLRAHFDAAILIMDTPFIVKDSPHIGVACLARDMPAVNTQCYSMGWGEDFNKKKYAVTLKKVQLPTVDPTTCQNQLRNTILGSNYQLHHTLTCAGGKGGLDTCTGDGGSALVCPVRTDGDSTRYFMYGIVAYGVGCGKQNVPGVYVKVPAIVQWVDRIMASENIDTRSYSIL